jgi:hypothetical protein
MIDIISVILAEYESIPFSLLELLFTKIIEPEKVKSKFSIMEKKNFEF